MNHSKRIIALVLALIFAFASFVTVMAAETANYKKGDINQNGKIDMTDYILLKRAYFGTFMLDEEQFKLGDINGNNKIDMIDYVLLKRAYFGTYELPEATPDEVTPDQVTPDEVTPDEASN